MATAPNTDWGLQLDGSLPKNDSYHANKAQMDKHVADLKHAVSVCYKGGGEKAIAKHKSRGKLLARERIDALVDPGSPFLELSTLAGWDMYGGGVSSGGVVTGIGQVNG